MRKATFRRNFGVFANFADKVNILPMLQSSKAIVIRTIKYSDSTLIADTYTEKEGRRSFAVHISKTGRGAVKKTLFSPMAILDIEWNEHGASKLPRLRSARPAHIYTSIPFSPVKMAITMFLSEFLSATLRAPVADGPVFEFVSTSLQWLDAEEGNCANFHIVFLLHLSAFIGLAPNFENHSEGSYFNMEDGCFTPMRPATQYIIEPSEAQYLPTLMRLKYSTAARIAIGRAVRTRLLQGIIQYYSIHLPSFPQLKSPEVLHEMFS